MIKRILPLLCLLSVITGHAKAPLWGKTGHRATAQIASTYLTKKTARKVNDLLGGKSMALVATFGDDIKSNPRYDRYRVWHYIDLPKGKTYAEIKADLGPNIISALKKCKAGLENPSTSHRKKQFYLKMLIHLMGDLHQPLHVGHPEDKGGNTIKVTWFGDLSNLHRVWDEDLLNSYLMSYSELARNQQLLSAQERNAIEKGGFVDWLKDTRRLTEQVYKNAKGQHRLGYDYMYKWMPVVRKQLQKGGIRLAKVLNAIFDSK